jgi:hypothetical protein
MKTIEFYYTPSDAAERINRTLENLQGGDQQL